MKAARFVLFILKVDKVSSGTVTVVTERVRSQWQLTASLTTSKNFIVIKLTVEKYSEEKKIESRLQLRT